MGVDWGQIASSTIVLIIAASITAVFFLIKKGIIGTVTEMVDTDQEPKKQTEVEPIPHQTTCPPTCSSHTPLLNVIDELKRTVEFLATTVKSSLEKEEKNASEIFQRLASLDSSQFANLQQLGEVRGQMGTIMADVAYVSAKMGKKHDAVMIKKEVTDTLLAFVDDRMDQMTPFIRLMENMGFQVSTAKGYNEAHSLLEALPFSYAVIDASLTPGEFEGVDLARWCISTFPKLKVFLYSGHDSLESIPPGCSFYRKPELSKLLADLGAAKKKNESRSTDTEE